MGCKCMIAAIALFIDQLAGEQKLWSKECYERAAPGIAIRKKLLGTRSY